MPAYLDRLFTTLGTLFTSYLHLSGLIMLLNNKKISQQNNSTLIAKVQSISLGKKIYIFILFMSIGGAVVGEIDARIAIKNCHEARKCLVSEPVEKRIRQVGVGACAGMVAASLLSLSAIINESSNN